VMKEPSIFWKGHFTMNTPFNTMKRALYTMERALHQTKEPSTLVWMARSSDAELSSLYLIIVCCSVLQCVHLIGSKEGSAIHGLVFESWCVAVRCSELQCVHLIENREASAIHELVFQSMLVAVSVAVCVAQCVAVCSPHREQGRKCHTGAHFSLIGRCNVSTYTTTYTTDAMSIHITHLSIYITNL